jgi:hypothetical protein
VREARARRGVKCAAGCGRRGVQQHHAVYEQEIRRRGGRLRDPRVLVPLCVRCHERHHSRVAPLPLWRLPDGVFEFAVELLGAGGAHEYLARRYAGGDPRHDALRSAS